MTIRHPPRHAALQLIDECERVNVKSGHDIHFERPEVFLSACERLLKKSG